MLGILLPRGILLAFSTSSNATSTQESEKEMAAVVKLSHLLLPSTWKNTQKGRQAYTGKKKKQTTDDALKLLSSQFYGDREHPEQKHCPFKVGMWLFSPTRESAVSQVLTGNISWENINFQSTVFTLLVHWLFESCNALIVFLFHECL